MCGVCDFSLSQFELKLINYMKIKYNKLQNFKFLYKENVVPLHHNTNCLNFYYLFSSIIERVLKTD